jgi:hypothetical protein
MAFEYDGYDSDMAVMRVLVAERDSSGSQVEISNADVEAHIEQCKSQSSILPALTEDQEDRAKFLWLRAAGRAGFNCALRDYRDGDEV